MNKQKTLLRKLTLTALVLSVALLFRVASPTAKASAQTPSKCFSITGTYTDPTTKEALHTYDQVSCADWAETGLDANSGQCFSVYRLNGSGSGTSADRARADVKDCAALFTEQVKAIAARDAGAPNTDNGTPRAPSTGTPSRIEDDDALIATLEQNPIYVRLIQVVNFLSAGVILIIIIAITISGIQYSASGDSPDMAKMAKDRIKNAVIALVLYLFMYALLQWIVPGGLF